MKKKDPTVSFDEFFPDWMKGEECSEDTQCTIAEVPTNGADRPSGDSGDLPRRWQSYGSTVEIPRQYCIEDDYEGEDEEDYDLWLRLH